jgi:acyl-CoA thioesterase
MLSSPLSNDNQITMAEPEHPFDSAIALDGLGDGRSIARTHAAYANMVGPFGGTIGAVLLQGALTHPSRLGDPVALTVNFASAIADGAYEIAAQAVRTNRSTQHWSIVATQAGEAVSVATAVFAKRRTTWSQPDVHAPDSVVPFDQVAPASSAGQPAWVSRYEMRVMTGPVPSVWDGREAPDSESCLWVRDNPPRPLDFASLAALCDTFMPRIFLRRRTPVPIGTVTMTTYFHADARMLIDQGDRPVLAFARALNFRDGYFDQSAQLWDDRRRLLASTHQLVYFRE